MFNPENADAGWSQLRPPLATWTPNLDDRRRLASSEMRLFAETHSDQDVSVLVVAGALTRNSTGLEDFKELAMAFNVWMAVQTRHQRGS